jgi:hypothetical protein
MFAKRKRISIGLNPGILPAVIHQMNAASRGLKHLIVGKGHPDEAEVTELYKDEEVWRHIVHLQLHTCSCIEWQLTGKSCPHALAIITSMRQSQMDLYVDQYYSVKKFQAAYHGIIPHITDRNQWPIVDKGFKLLPLIVTEKRGKVGLRRIGFLDLRKDVEKELDRCNVKDANNMGTCNLAGDVHCMNKEKVICFPFHICTHVYLFLLNHYV